MPEKRKLLAGFFEEFKLVTGEGCKSSIKQLIEVFQLMLKCQYTPDEYYYYRFYEKDKNYAYMLNFMSNFYSLEYYHPKLNDPGWKQVISNKLIFNRYFGSLGVPVTKLYGYFDHQLGFTLDGMSLKTLCDLKRFLELHTGDSLVFKPVAGGKGKNILIIDKIAKEKDSIICTTGLGQKLEISELYKINAGRNGEDIKSNGYMIEEKVKQHESIKLINPHNLNTLRVVTLLNKDQEAKVYLAVFRLGRAGAFVDNISQGGLLVQVNLSTGSLGEGTFNINFRGSRHSKHPDTGVEFRGFKIPFWEESIELCKKAANLIPFCRSIGWDVAITPEGPLLIEGNSKWAINLQVLTRGFLQAEVREDLSGLGLVFPANKLPPFKFKPMIRALKRWKGLSI